MILLSWYTIHICIQNLKSVKLSAFFTFVFYMLVPVSVWAQSATDELIESKQDKLKSQLEELEKIQEELEELKLQKIRESLSQYIPEDPKEYEIVTHSAMILSYNEEHEQANWVMHIIPKDVITGINTRSNDFRPDPNVSTGTADVDDYWDSGYDRGHMAPSADFRWSKRALSESYYYSNISPQTPELNREAWSSLETQIREWVIEYGDLLILTGPILKDSLPKTQQGSYRLSIPELNFKIVVDLKPEKPKALAFLFENTKEVTYNLKEKLVTIDSIEVLTGINFFPNMPNAEEFESVSDLSEWSVSTTKISEAPSFKYDLGHVPSRQASYFIGADCTICGKVVATRYNKNTQTGITYLNFDEHFPNSPFTTVIFGKDRINFSYEPEIYLKDKMICVNGKVQLYKGKPQIVATNEKQFSIYKE